MRTSWNIERYRPLKCKYTLCQTLYERTIYSHLLSHSLSSPCGVFWPGLQSILRLKWHRFMYLHHPWTATYARCLQRRSRVMLRSFAHPSTPWAAAQTLNAVLAATFCLIVFASPKPFFDGRGPSCTGSSLLKVWYGFKLLFSLVRMKGFWAPID